METRRVHDPRAFQAAVEPYLRRDEARHNLMLGLLETLVERPDVYPEHELWAVEDGGKVVGAALRTPPHNLIVAAPATEGVLASLASAVADEDAAIPGVVAAAPEVDLFLAAYAPAAGVVETKRQAQAIHVLGALSPVPAPSGFARDATPDDVDLILAWSRAFHEESMSDVPWSEAQARRNLAYKVPDGSGGGIRLWEDDGPTCLVGYVDATRRVARIGPVYTPPELRRRGYATALTHHVSRTLLERGKALCLLYTDLANPTSNAIYRRIGYEVVCRSAMVTLGEAP